MLWFLIKLSLFNFNLIIKTCGLIFTEISVRDILERSSLRGTKQSPLKNNISNEIASIDEKSISQ